MAGLLVSRRLRRNRLLREIVNQPLWIANVDMRRLVLDNFATSCSQSLLGCPDITHAQVEHRPQRGPARNEEIDVLAVDADDVCTFPGNREAEFFHIEARRSH